MRFNYPILLFLPFIFLTLNRCDMPEKTNDQPEISTQSPLLFVGTYTKKEGHVDGKGEGIYILKMDTATGALSPLDTIRGLVNPSYLTLHPNGRYLYAVQELADNTPDNIGLVSAFKTDPENGRAQALNTVSAQGDAPCFISTDATGRFALVANYVSGNVAVFPIQPDGQLGEAVHVAQHEPGIPKPPRQEAPHAHMIIPGKEPGAVFATDLGTDLIIHYQLDTAGHLTKRAETHTEPGAGPRHLAFHPTLSRVYVLNELAH
ncbi:MAG: lactonase family protein, partial [Bacteroidetes bacterium]